MSPKKVIIVGASSEIAQEVSVKLSKNFEVINLSRKPIKNNCCTNAIISDYSAGEIDKFLDTLNKSDSHTFIFFNGVSDTEIFLNISDEEINDVFKINLYTPIIFTKKIL